MLVITAGALLIGGACRQKEDGAKGTMRIQFERSGGFAGIRLTTSVDSAALPDDDARRLREMVDGAGFFELPPVIGKPAPDRFQYRLTVEDGKRRHTVEVNEAAVPPSLRPLIDWLTSAARKGGKPATGSG